MRRAQSHDCTRNFLACRRPPCGARPASAAHAAISPTELVPINAVRPGYSSGLRPFRPNQKKVLDSPSKETEARAKSRKSVPLNGSARVPASFAPGRQRDSSPFPFVDRVLATIPNRAAMPKKTERNSPRRLHASKPKMSIMARLNSQ